MASLTNPTIVASGGGRGFPRWAVLAFQVVTADDTFDMATSPLGSSPSITPFTKVTSALFVATSNRTATTTLATIAGTVVTMKGTGVAADAGLLFVVGE